MKIHSTLLVIWEKKLKPQWDTITHLLERKTKIKRTDNVKHWRGYGAIGTLTHCWQEFNGTTFCKQFGSSL